MLVTLLLQLTGPVQGFALEKFLIKVLCATTFDELKIPFVAVATNEDQFREQTAIVPYVGQKKLAGNDHKDEKQSNFLFKLINQLI